MVDVPDEYEHLRGEDELYDLWLETEQKAIEIADRLKLTDDEVNRILSRWSAIGEPDGHAVAAMAKHIATIRSIREMVEMMRPGEEMVPMKELAARLRGKGEA